eukprot:CRZ11858.1 hypothetical protein [Spongospora subterranea]
MDTESHCGNIASSDSPHVIKLPAVSDPASVKSTACIKPDEVRTLSPLLKNAIMPAEYGSHKSESPATRNLVAPCPLHFFGPGCRDGESCKLSHDSNSAGWQRPW